MPSLPRQGSHSLPILPICFPTSPCRGSYFKRQGGCFLGGLRVKQWVGPVPPSSVFSGPPRSSQFFPNSPRSSQFLSVSPRSSWVVPDPPRSSQILSDPPSALLDLPRSSQFLPVSSQILSDPPRSSQILLGPLRSSQCLPVPTPRGAVSCLGEGSRPAVALALEEDRPRRHHRMSEGPAHSTGLEHIPWVGLYCHWVKTLNRH